MNKENNFGRLLILLFITLLGGISLYWLPETIWGHQLKKVDLLSDIRIKPEPLSLDSLIKQLEEQDTIPDSIENPDTLSLSLKIDSANLALRDSLYKTIYTADGADSLGTHIEDYSIGHLGLNRFFSALNKRKTLKRPVRIAVLGDSFIEGDILVADLRAALQKKFGGQGVGFVPVFTVTDQFRPTINQKAEGWKSYSLLKDTTHAFMLSGMLFNPGHNASLTIKKAEKYPDLSNVPLLKFYYSGMTPGSIKYVTDINPDTVIKTLPAKASPACIEIKKDFNQGTFVFSGGTDTQVFGTALEEDEGIVVDNYSLRGNSGLILDRLNIELCHDFSDIRPYDLIILQYGLNVVSEEVLNYGWYRSGMTEVVKHMQACFPDADILLMGVSDRAYQTEDSFETMPAVLALLHAQRQTAKRTGITFWNTFGAMGGVNSMTRYVENNWASKDYTHLSFRGGREIAKALFDALLLEKEFYDEAEESLH
ncbi:hypothetical protein [Massilibacteroides sp.]|uniref:hypothetical protein n=1 Tax=Massilibacteroides sp. TaxID=2034766 RepID=UPI00261CFD1C|nr:hypothetical protein [Massilibacteroides sp.]MDD4515601.1 hypothetical protein [Massilibacteroides sp.]